MGTIGAGLVRLDDHDHAKDKMCVAYMALASAAVEAGDRQWILRPKLHVSWQVFHQTVSNYTIMCSCM